MVQELFRNRDEVKDQRKDDAEESIFDDNLGRDNNVNSPTFQYGKFSHGVYSILVSHTKFITGTQKQNAFQSPEPRGK